MQQDIIKDKAQDYVSRLYEEDEYPDKISDIEADVECAFADGANWRIGSVWHDVKEKPEINKPFLFESDFDGQSNFSTDIFYREIVNWGTYFTLQKLVRWEYIEDLIPTEGGK